MTACTNSLSELATFFYGDLPTLVENAGLIREDRDQRYRVFPDAGMPYRTDTIETGTGKKANAGIYLLQWGSIGCIIAE
jgi:hypothetical protein